MPRPGVPGHLSSLFCGGHTLPPVLAHASCPRCLECFLQAPVMVPNRGCNPPGAPERCVACFRGVSEVCAQRQLSWWTSRQAAAPNWLSFRRHEVTSLVPEWPLQHCPRFEREGILLCVTPSSSSSGAHLFLQVKE